MTIFSATDIYDDDAADAGMRTGAEVKAARGHVALAARRRPADGASN